MQTIGSQEFDKVVFGNPIGFGRGDGLWAQIEGRWYKISANRMPVPTNYPVTPAMIKNTRFVGVFGRDEFEQFAEKLVQFAQQMGAWEPFAMDDFSPAGWGDWVVACNSAFLVRLGFLVKDGDGHYQFTIGFVNEVLAYQM